MSGVSERAGGDAAGAGLFLLRLVVNGREVAVEVDLADRLLDVLRYRLGLVGTKEGCAEGECGSCTVWLDGVPVDSCLVPAWQARGRRVETVEGVEEAWLEPFLESGATQCGACTPGVVMTARWIAEHPDVLRTHTPRELMAGNLCRCTGYDGIIDGLRAALDRAAAAGAAASGAAAGGAAAERGRVGRGSDGA